MLVVITGVRGAGKTTLRDRLQKERVGTVLQPSTTRAPRFPGEDEYEFVQRWVTSRYAWTIEVNGNKYGYRKSEIKKAHTQVCVVVFEPNQLDVLRQFAASQSFETIVVGLDTIATSGDQAKRVAYDEKRLMSFADFEKAKRIVTEADLILNGDEDTLFAAMVGAISVLSGRGGVLTRAQLAPLIAAGSLLSGTTDHALRHASYDLRLGNQVWTNRKLTILSDQSSTFEIAPYSYAIVTAAEEANLPTFITAIFDIKVSLFLRGLILSNGPQIDPGYRGQLFCMLFNGSSAPITLSAGLHFSTLEFTTTNRATTGYRQRYQLQHKLAEIMSEGGMSGPGGNIIAEFSEKIGAIETKIAGLQNPHWPALLAVLGVALAIAFIPVALAYTLVSDAEDKIDDATELLDQARAVQAAPLVPALEQFASPSPIGPGLPVIHGGDTQAGN